MKIKGLTEKQIEECAERAGAFRLDNVRTIGNYVFFVLRMKGLTPTRAERNWMDRHDTVVLKGEEAKRYADLAARLHYRKRGSDMQRWTGAVCFHGHKAFMDEIFEVNPAATVVTTIIRYEGKEEFDRKWVDAGSRPNIATVGPSFHGNQYREMCDCYGG